MKIEELHIGDKVSVYGKMDNIDFKGEIGEIILIHSSAGWARIKFPTSFNKYLHGKDNCCYDVYFHLIYPSNSKRILNLKDDPWGEENWGWEEISEN